MTETTRIPADAIEVDEIRADSTAFQDAVSEQKANPPQPVFVKGTPLDNVPSAEEPIMRFFDYAHLPTHLQAVSMGFYQLAKRITDTLPKSAERSVALRKLLESKDAAVRAALDAPQYKSAGAADADRER